MLKVNENIKRKKSMFPYSIACLNALPALFVKTYDRYLCPYIYQVLFKIIKGWRVKLKRTGVPIDNNYMSNLAFVKWQLVVSILPFVTPTDLIRLEIKMYESWLRCWSPASRLRNDNSTFLTCILVSSYKAILTLKINSSFHPQIFQYKIN